MAHTSIRWIPPSLVVLVLVAGVANVSSAAMQPRQTPPPAQTPPPTPPATSPPGSPVAVPAPPSSVQGQGAQAATPAPAPPARPTPPDVKAYTEAMKLTDPAPKLDALRKVQADFPSSFSAQNADNAILDLTLANWPDRRQDIIQTIDRIVGNIPAGIPADFRLTQVQSLVTKLVDKNVLLDKAEAIVGDAMEELEKQSKLTQARAIELLATIHLQRGDSARAEREFREALAANSTLVKAPLELGKIEAKRGNDKAALDFLLTASIVGHLKPADDEMLHSLYKKVRGSEAGFEAAIDTAYSAKFPNPVTPQPYQPTTKRSDRIVLGELFTGSGCGPCVAADLAMEDLLKRYPAGALLALAYHANIPQPDPMVVAGGEIRRKYYAVNGVPTFHVDGMEVGLGGGPRESTSRNYGEYVSAIDKELEAPAKAAIAVQITSDGARVKVTATVSRVAPDAKDPRIQIVLAERQLRFMGENGIRYHEMVVRGVALDPAAASPASQPASNPGSQPVSQPSGQPAIQPTGQPSGQLLSQATGFVVRTAGDTTVEYSFDLTTIKADITKSLDDEIVKRRKTETPGNTPREYRAEAHPMVAIDPSALVVVAFVQDGDHHILQAVCADLANWKAPSGGR